MHEYVLVNLRTS